MFNKPERIADMRSETDSIFEAGKISSKQASQLRGKLSFAEAQPFARDFGGHDAQVSAVLQMAPVLRSKELRDRLVVLFIDST
eukprot:3332229-Amphidinium_carterae.1